MTFTVEVRDSLAHFSDAVLDRVTSNASVFFDRRWFRMLDAVDLAPLVGGEIVLHYVVVSRGMELVGICPFIVTRSKSIYWFYSLDKYFFSSWQDKLLRLDPMRAEQVRKVSRIVAAYHAFAHATGVRTHGWVLAVSPLSYRGDIVLAPMSAEDEQSALDAVIAILQEFARDQGLPLCFFGVQEDKTHLQQALVQRGCEELFLTYDNLLQVSSQSFTDYVDQLDRSARRRFNREIKQAREAGVRFEITQELGNLSTCLADLYTWTCSQYGEEHLHYPASFWVDLERYIVPHAEAIIAYNGREPIGFALLLSKNEETWGQAIGRSYRSDVAGAAVYFNLAFYEPIKRAIVLGAKRIWIGPGFGEAKQYRGATKHALYSHLWFPRRWARSVLMPYLQKFSQINKQLADRS